MKNIGWLNLGIATALVIVPAFADDGGHHGDNNRGGNNSFSSALIGSTPGAMAGGVAAAGAPWVVSQASASLSSNGNLEVETKGLLLGPGAPATLVGTVGPVQMVAASVICGGSGGTVVASTAGVALNASGNAKIEASIALPASCTAPAVIVRIFNPAAAPGSQLGGFIALTGITPSSNNGNAGDDNHDHHDN